MSGYMGKGERGGRGGEDRGDSRDRGERGGRNEERDRDYDERKGGGRAFARKKQCRFCSDTDFILDYKEVRIMQSFLTEHGKIVPRRISGSCAKHQRELTSAIKRARQLALVGYVSQGF